MVIEDKGKIMNITNTSHTTSSRSVTSAKSLHYAEPVNKSNVKDNGNGDCKLILSGCGTQLSKGESANTGKANQTDKQYTDLEHFRLPNWLPGMTANRVINGGKAVEETRELIKMYERARSDGIITDNEQRKIDEFRRTSMPDNDSAREYHYFYQKHGNEIEEYNGIFRNAFDEAKAEHGIESHKDYVEKVLNVPGDNIVLRNSVVSKLLENPRAVELMDVLKIQRPVIA